MRFSWAGWVGGLAIVGCTTGPSGAGGSSSTSTLSISSTGSASTGGGIGGETSSGNGGGATSGTGAATSSGSGGATSSGSGGGSSSGSGGASSSGTSSSASSSVGASSSSGGPTCAANEIDCGGKCVDPLNTPDHCGATADCLGANAGAVCHDAACLQGACTCMGSGEILCGDTCKRPYEDPNFCGATGDCLGANAGQVCGANQVCHEGICLQTCAAGCAAGTVCEGAACVPCTMCNGSCVDFTHDPQHCGSCSGVCAANQVCTAGVCTGALFALEDAAQSKALFRIDLETATQTLLHGVSALPDGFSLASLAYAPSINHFYATGVSTVLTPPSSAWTAPLPAHPASAFAYDATVDVVYACNGVSVKGLDRYTLADATVLPNLPSDCAALAIDNGGHRLFAVVRGDTFLRVHDFASATWSVVGDTKLRWGGNLSQGPMVSYVFSSSLTYDERRDVLIFHRGSHLFPTLDDLGELDPTTAATLRTWAHPPFNGPVGFAEVVPATCGPVWGGEPCQFGVQCLAFSQCNLAGPSSSCVFQPPGCN